MQTVHSTATGHESPGGMQHQLIYAPVWKSQRGDAIRLEGRHTISMAIDICIPLTTLRFEADVLVQRRTGRSEGRIAVSTLILDGTEISEAISTAIHLQHKKMKPLFYAPDIEICGVVNHFTKEMNTENSRNALVESARLARGCIKPLHECEACTHDALIIPGGFGAARILSNFAEKGTDCTVLPDLEKLIEDFHCDKKPIGTMCIANALVAKVLKGVKITLGKESPKNDWPHADAIKKVKDMGAKIEMKDVKGVTFDKNFGVLSTPAWLYEPATFSDIYDGIDNMAVFAMNSSRVKVVLEFYGNSGTTSPL
ncbi:hypothetical protein ALC53_02612 [Atta colombica]|uniref:ES1 protein like protein, mitochondrial n=1 Tax=Atta colombica TaxID=520822 RepID=A0A195BS67_9HYME|nr:hypothetical protein ALC53_02612 [Atta colombica]